MDPNTRHYKISVFEPGTRPPYDDPVETTLCPEGRSKPGTLEVWPSRVTCKRCRQLLDLLWLDNPERGRP